jgi:hypothetical protein
VDYSNSEEHEIYIFLVVLVVLVVLVALVASQRYALIDARSALS